MARAASTTGPGKEEVRLLLKICEGMHAHVKGLIKANVSS
jgi:hypothetical protein